MRTLQSASSITKKQESCKTRLLTTRKRKKAKLKVLHRLAEFRVYETVDLQVALGKNRVTTRWRTDQRKDGIRARFVAREFKGNKAMCDAFAPCSTPSTGRIIDYSQEVVSHVLSGRDKRVLPRGRRRGDLRGPTSWMVGAASSIGNPTSVIWRLRKQLYGRRRAGTRWVDFMPEHLRRAMFRQTRSSTKIICELCAGCIH